MGLYSTNRVVQLATYNSNIDFEHIDTDESAPNLLESSIMLHEADQQMFDTLIGLDFVEAHNEQAMLEDSNANDNNADDTAVSKNIFQKIIDIIQKAIEVVKNAIKTAINKVREFINNTANKVVVARLKNYDWSKFEKFKIKRYTVPIVMKDYKTDDVLKRITELKTFVSSADVDNASAEDLEAKIKGITDYTKTSNDNRDYIAKKTDTEYTVTADIAKKAVNIISTADKTISDFNKAGNEATMALLKLKQRVGKPKDDAKAANNLYSFATKASKAVTKLVQAVINEHIATLKLARSIAFKIGRGKAKASDNAKANTTNNNESAYDSFVGSISDIYVENYFADLFD